VNALDSHFSRFASGRGDVLLLALGYGGNIWEARKYLSRGCLYINGIRVHHSNVHLGADDLFHLRPIAMDLNRFSRGVHRGKLRGA